MAFLTKAAASAFILTALAAVIASQLTAHDYSRKILKANARFAKDVYKVLAKEPGNVFFSPISAHTVLSLVYQGAKNETSKHMAKVLRLPDQKSSADGYRTLLQKFIDVENVTLDIANAVYVKSGYKVKKSFAETASRSFSSEVDEVDFAKGADAAALINSWVERETHDKIKDLIKDDDLDDMTRLLLLNAIYFNGKWLTEFNKTETRKEPFYVKAGEVIDVDMMHVKSKFRYGSNKKLGAHILELPYYNRDSSMLVILPIKRYGINKLEKKLAGVDLMKLAKDLKEQIVDVSLPKFKLETTVQFKDILKKLGLDIIFSENANFSGLLDRPEQLHVSDLIQKAFIEVNEEGAEASAATEVIMTWHSATLPPPMFIADHPFLVSLAFQKTALFFGKIERI